MENVHFIGMSVSVNMTFFYCNSTFLTKAAKNLAIKKQVLK